MKINLESIFGNFESIVARRGSHPSVIYLGTKYSFSVLKDLAQRFAVSLVEMGVKPGERVILYIPNSIQWVVAWLGILRVGAVNVPITPIYTPYDLKYIANDAGAETIVCADTNFGYVIKVLPETGLKRVIVTNMADLLPWWKRLFGFFYSIVPRGKININDNIFSFRKVLKINESHRLPEINRNGKDDLVEILYTGGTAKRPKGVPLQCKTFLEANSVVRVSLCLIGTT